jgi:hypothetical protein
MNAIAPHASLAATDGLARIKEQVANEIRNEVRNWSTGPMRVRQLAPGAWWCFPEAGGHAGYVVSQDAGFPVQLLSGLELTESCQTASGRTLYLFDDDVEWAVLEAQSEALVARSQDLRMDLARAAYDRLELRPQGAALRRAFPNLAAYRGYVARVAAQARPALDEIREAA